MKQTTFQLLFGLIAGLALGYFLFHNCNKPKPCPDIIIKTDTVLVSSKDSTGWYKPEISFLEGGRIPFAGFYKPKPAIAKKDNTGFSGDFDFTHVDTTKPLDYFDDGDSAQQSQTTFNFYKDRVNTKYGAITIEDTLRNNQIAARRVTTDFNIPVVTNTVTVTEKRKAHLFWDVTAIGDQKANINAAGGGFTFQFKDTRAVQVHALYQFKKLYPGQSNTQFQFTLINPFSKH